jgi:hypothetical protein
MVSINDINLKKNNFTTAANPYIIRAGSSKKLIASRRSGKLDYIT